MQRPIFKNKPVADEKKLRGGYYTPVELAEYLTAWAIRTGAESILEPSCGDGNFLVAALSRLNQLYGAEPKQSPHLVAVEVLESEIERAQSRCSAQVFPGLTTEWICDDFFASYGDQLKHSSFDVIIGNPPFIRFQYFDPEVRDIAFNHLRDASYRPTKLANAWAAFVQLSVELLKPGGRLAMVVPAELLQVGYASELRDRLSRGFEDIGLIGFRQLVFPQIQQEVVLLLAEGKTERPNNSARIHTVEYINGQDLPSKHDFLDAVQHAPEKYTRSGMKWTSLFLDDREFDALSAAQSHNGLVSLGDLARVEVGVVTGRNSFFVLDQESVKSAKAARFVTKVVGRTNALRSIEFSADDFGQYAARSPAYLLDLSRVTDKKFTKGLQEYIQAGEDAGVNTGYKCRIRKRWYDVPSIYVPDGFMFRQIHQFPLLVSNEAGATSTDTIHRVRIKGDTDIKQLAFRAFNSLTFAWSEVCGRSYGGGVLELEPREAQELPIPDVEIDQQDVRKLDNMLRNARITEALDFADEVLLRRGLGFGVADVKLLRSSWETLRDRRIGRR
ncbi:N-6 DNA methylase [Parvularcula marina]|uniref:site-specific DNA-methyltransferase (adenine-specific) n=1 Tax=Parvularcula marina TaxID=2292771 RepID=A0A371RL25_9PROT|nr:N-6 DNA methylase [Parvularcula marina]RFB06144.1 class I SAM-dependent methyltransferase [Parvularcula marina]